MHKKILHLLSLILLCLVILSKPSISSASELIGTHLGEGDVGAQINIIRGILINNGLEPGSPVTAMVPVTMLQDGQRGTLSELNDALSEGGFFPIIRINGVCSNFENETQWGSDEAVKRAKEIFPGAVIVWGNEINNQETECDNWPKYVSDWNNIGDKSNVSPSALDYYMGNDDFTVSKMFETAGMSAIFNHSPRVGNVYGCVGGNTEACDPATTVTQQVGYGSIGNPFYLTEFSLSPEGRSPDAPDTDVKKVLDFLATRASETGAQKITPLVRNVCNSEGEWLLYINGKLFTTAGTDVSENCEGGGGNDGYDISKYPEYGVLDELFYLSPIRSVIKGGTPDRTVENIRKELASSGYEAYCASEGVEIKPQYGTDSLISKFLDQYPEGISLDTDSVEKLNFTNAKYPLWRDVSDKQFLMTSLEEYFGFKDVYEEDPAQSIVTSAPINSLLSQRQMCVQGWKNLVAQQLTCERLENIGECALLNRPIPDTSFTISTLLDELKEFEPYYREGKDGSGCSELFSEFEPKWDELRKGLVNTPTYFDRAYRYGFIVAAIETKSPLKNGNLATKIFNFFTDDTETTLPKHEVLATAFKLPDIGTNKGGGDDSGSQFWDDPLSLTRKLLNTVENNLNHEDNLRPAERRRVEQESAAASNQGSDSKIFCYDGAYPNGTGTKSCQNEMTKALTDIVNGSAKGCGPTEDVRVISDVAGLSDPEDPYGKIFNSDNGGQVLLNLFGAGDSPDITHEVGGIYDPQQAKTDDPADKLKSIFTINPDTWSSKTKNTKVDFYIIYPKGFEVKAVEDSVKGLFFTKKQIEEMDNDPTIVDGFEMSGQKMSLSGGSVGWDFIDLEKTAAGGCGFSDPIDPVTGELIIPPPPNTCTESIDIKIKQEAAGVGIIGGRLGWWLRKIQVALNPRDSEAYKYFESCRTTEEFLLGRCPAGNFDRTDGTESGDTDYDTCGLDLGTGYCSPENLTPYFAEEGFENPELEADKASRICQRESRGNPTAFNARCLAGTSVDYSLGLFQINMLPRCPGSFADADGNLDTTAEYDPYNIPCEIVDQERLNECALSKVAINTQAQEIINEHLPSGATPVELDSQAEIDIKAENNIRAMVKIRKSWGNWGAWTAGAAACSIE